MGKNQHGELFSFDNLWCVRGKAIYGFPLHTEYHQGEYTVIMGVPMSAKAKRRAF